MSEKIYQSVWNKYLPVIILKLKSAVKKNESQSFSMDRIDFENASNRKNAKFQFSIEMKDGHTLKNNKTSSIALDFARALKDDVNVKEIIKSGHFKFDMNNKFILSIHVN